MVFHVSQNGWHRVPFAVALTAGLLAMGSLTACGSGEDAPRSEDVAEPEPVASPVAPAREGAQRAVVSDILPYAEVDEELVYGHFVFPSDMIEPLPAIILIHEWWGLDDNVKTAADRLAAEGYIVLAVDLFAGRTAEDVSDARTLMLEVVENQALASANIQQAVDFVADTAGAPAVAAMGWGLGGSWALNAAILAPDDLDAAVTFYGQVSDDADRLAAVSVPMLGFFAENDRGVAAADVRAFGDVMSSIGKDVEIVMYPDAGHGFANPDNRNYDPELAEQSWQQTLEFFSASLSDNGGA